jgi:hypothetical protein
VVALAAILVKLAGLVTLLLNHPHKETVEEIVERRV